MRTVRNMFLATLWGLVAGAAVYATSAGMDSPRVWPGAVVGFGLVTGSVYRHLERES